MSIMLATIRSKIDSLKNHQGFRRYAANTSWMMAEQVLRIIAGLFVGIWVARYLGPEQFGLFSYVLAFSAIFGGVAKLGLDSILVRELVNEPEKRDIYMGTAFWLKVVGGVLIIVLLALVVPHTSNDPTTNLFIFIIAGGLVFQSLEVVEFYFRSIVLAKVISICKLLQLALSSLIKIYLVLSNSELIYFVIVVALDYFFLAASYFVAYVYRVKKSFFLLFDLAIAKDLLSRSWPLVFSSIALMLQAKIDIIMLKSFSGDIAVGHYSAALKIVESLGFIPVIIANSFFPAVQNAKNLSELLYRERLISLYRLMFLVFAVSGGLLYLFSQSIMSFLYGEEYIASGVLLGIMAARLLFTNFGVIRSLYITSEGFFRYSLLTMIVGTFVNIVLNYFWIPLYGEKGCVFATIISFFVTVFLIDFVFYVARDNARMQILAIFTFYKVYRF